ncbi:YkuS family protein [Alkaliphilus transvaalensis]|uniref:YkuS family protein n=1 Tax=Alkaliphilus transvaalensis TaxID=114628 RepID=UPI0004798C0B|nr:YkuS family protein [Alkaliphilus transvaalensis]
MKKRVAIEHSLTDVKDYLQSKGFKVENLDHSRNLDAFDAVVVTGQDSNTMGIENAQTKTPIITARGLSAEAVYDQIESRLNRLS